MLPLATAYANCYLNLFNQLNQAFLVVDNKNILNTESHASILITELVKQICQSSYQLDV